MELQVVPNLDLSSTEWPDFPNSEVMNAAIFVARGRVNGYPDRFASGSARHLAERHGVDPEQIVFGNGATELLQEAAHLLLAPGDELVTHWPSYPLFPLMAARAGARPVAVDSAGGAADPEAMLAAVTDRTRVVVVCNPNDPTGDYLPSQSLRWLLSQLPDHVHVLLDEAYVHFQDIEPIDACLRLVERVPAPPRVPHVLQGLWDGGAARRLRGRLDRGLARARGDRAAAGRQRPHPGRGRVRAVARRRRGRPAPEPGHRAAQAGAGGHPRAAGRRQRQPGATSSGWRSRA